MKKRMTQSSPARRRSSRRLSKVARPAFLQESEQQMRLQKFLSTAGVDSRRNCEEFIRTGRVTVDGVVVTDPAHSVAPQQQDIRMDGEKLELPGYRYFLINKPKGVVCTHKDPAGRPRAVDLVPAGDMRMFTVGRLDENTEGLLLVTNDGGLAEYMAHPRYEVVRRYRAQVAGVPEPETLAELRRGMHFSDGFFHFHTIRVLKRRGRSTFLELELQEGKNREIRRLLARAGHKVISLERISFGPLRLGRLQPGQFRELKHEEVAELYEFISTAPEKRKYPRRKKRASSAQSGKRTRKTVSTEESTRSRRGAARFSANSGRKTAGTASKAARGRKAGRSSAKPAGRRSRKK